LGAAKSIETNATTRHHTPNLNGKEKIVAKRLEGKTAAITGGHQGIGRAIVERFAQEGANIVFCYRSNKVGADETVAAVTALGARRQPFRPTSGKSRMVSGLSPNRCAAGRRRHSRQ